MHIYPHHRGDCIGWGRQMGKTMDALGIAKSAGQRIGKELRNALLEECDNILRSYQAQMREGASLWARTGSRGPGIGRASSRSAHTKHGRVRELALALTEPVASGGRIPLRSLAEGESVPQRHRPTFSTPPCSCLCAANSTHSAGQGELSSLPRAAASTAAREAPASTSAGAAG